MALCVCVKNTLSAFLFFVGRKGKEGKQLKMSGWIFKAQRAQTATALLRSPRFTTPVSWPQSATARCLCSLPRGSAWRRNSHSDLVCALKRKAPSSQATLQVRFEPATAKAVTELFGHGSTVRSLCAHQGRWLFSGSDDCTVRLWDLHGGSAVRTFSGHTGAVLKVVAFSKEQQQPSRLVRGRHDFSRVGCGDRHFR